MVKLRTLKIEDGDEDDGDGGCEDKYNSRKTLAHPDTKVILSADENKRSRE